MPIEVPIQRRLLDNIQQLEAAASLAGLIDENHKAATIDLQLSSPLLRVGVFGDSGNGKSTLVNSLIGSPLLPMGMCPATRIPARVIKGQEERIALYYPDQTSIYTTPDGATRLSSEQAERIEILGAESPASILDHILFDDSPGLSISSPTDRPAPSSSLSDYDCLIFVLNCDRLLSLTELNMIRDQVATCGVARCIFVLNRMDGKTDSDIISLMDRAHRLLSPIFPSPTIFRYSALQSLQTALCGQKDLAKESDPDGLEDLIVRRWVEETDTIKIEATQSHLQLLAQAIEIHLESEEKRLSESLQVAEMQLQAASQAASEARSQFQMSLEQLHRGIQSVQNQFSVGLREFGLQVRESLPKEVAGVPIEETRRFVPFYLQELLRRAVDENQAAVKEAIDGLLSNLPEIASQAAHQAMDSLRVDVEPPATPLYTARDRTPVSQGASFMMGAGGLLAFSEFYPGVIILLSSLLAREAAHRLEASERRSNLCEGAQSLIQTAIQSMDRSLQEQLEIILGATIDAAKQALAPELDQLETRVQHCRLLMEDALVAVKQFQTAASASRELLKVAGFPTSTGNPEGSTEEIVLTPDKSEPDSLQPSAD